MRVIATLAVVLTTLLPVLPAAAQTAQSAPSARGSDAILTAMQTEALLAVLQDEAVKAGEDLADSMMPGRPVEGWTQTVARINAPSGESSKRCLSLCVMASSRSVCPPR